MGIVEETLAEFELEDGRKCRIEDNASGAIHIHIGAIRIDMTKQEFRHFAEEVLEAHKELRQVKEWE